MYELRTCNYKVRLLPDRENLGFCFSHWALCLTIKCETGLFKLGRLYKLDSRKPIVWMAEAQIAFTQRIQLQKKKTKNQIIICSQILEVNLITITQNNQINF